MMRALCLPLLLVLVLTGATCQRRGDAPPADAPAMCYAPCTPSLTDTGVRWEGDPGDPAAWDNLAAPDGTVGILAGKLLTCEQRRQACAGFIGDLKARRVLRAKR